MGLCRQDGENGCFGKSGRIWVLFTMPASGQWTRWRSTTPLQPLPSAVFLDAFWKDGKDGTLSTRQETEALDKARNRAEDGAKRQAYFRG